MRVVTMGEMMIRLMPCGNLRIEQASSFDAWYGGDEAIVASILARLGADVRYVTKLPENILGETALGKLREQGIDVSFIARGGERLGLNFYENGASVRPSVVLYDRKHSSISEADPEDFDFDAIFDGADWFHVSGITPALGAKAAELVRLAMAAAKRHGATVSVDLNYRGKLWTPEEARAVMVPLMRDTDVCIGGAEDAAKMLGVGSLPATDTEEHDLDALRSLFRTLRERFGFRLIASTLRESRSASDNRWSALLSDGEGFHHTRTYDIHLVDRGGGGATFSGALIYSLLSGFPLEKAGEFAVAASALKQTVTGDFPCIHREEIESLMGGKGTGRVQR
ncbi:MAG: sugar kinase [Clostridia bacterium]|nr:sugar kinase [Clostridia bacterium]